MVVLKADGDNSVEKWCDSAFACLFLICLFTVVALASKAFKRNPQMVNLPNILIVTFLLLTLFSKLNLIFKQHFS